MSFTIINADCRETMAEMEQGSIDAVICDPPYGLKFMGKGWDHGVPGVPYWEKAFIVLKPGAHLVAFGGTRTFHRLTAAIEDAGFEVRDCLSWMYGQGFPKSMDVSKAIDKAAGAEREVTGPPKYARGRAGQQYSDTRRVSYDYPPQPQTAPATPEAEQWQGWGTALKPAWEPIILARKPLDGTVAETVLEHSTGALNIDGTRIVYASESDLAATRSQTHKTSDLITTGVYGADRPQHSVNNDGRWPANVVLVHHENCVQVGTRKVKAGTAVNRNRDSTTSSRNVCYGDRSKPTVDATHADSDGTETVPVFDCHNDCPVRLLDEQTGELRSGKAASGGHQRRASKGKAGGPALHQASLHSRDDAGSLYGDKGGASRFFYCAKVSKKERNAGLPEDMKNDHPTCKPVNVMAWLCRLVTPPGGVVLDPFMGSGSTGVAAITEGFRFIGIDVEAHYCDIARYRLEHAGRSVP